MTARADWRDGRSEGFRRRLAGEPLFTEPEREANDRQSPAGAMYRTGLQRGWGEDFHAWLRAQLRDARATWEQLDVTPGTLRRWRLTHPAQTLRGDAPPAFITLELERRRVERAAANFADYARLQVGDAPGAGDWSPWEDLGQYGHLYGEKRFAVAWDDANQRADRRRDAW